MKINASSLFIFLAIVVIAFTGGYWLGSYQSPKFFGGSDAFTSLNNAQIEASPTNENVIANKQSNDTKTNKVDANSEAGTPLGISAENATETPLTIDNLVLLDDASVMDIIGFLAAIEASEDVTAFEKFGPALDALRDTVKNNPDNFQILLDYFADSDLDSHTPYYLTSVLHSAEIADKDLLMNNLVMRLSAQGTASGDTRLLHLVSSRGMHLENEQVVATVKNIALYSQTGNNNKTFALDLLMPYQLNEDEKNKVVTDLSFALNQAPQGEVSYIVENIIRFSDKTQRVALATNYLDETNSFETRVAILSTMHNGSISPNDALKNALFSIAENTNDPLSVHARDTLMYVFEINNAEYNRLRSGG